MVKIDYSWDEIKEHVLSLKNRLGMGDVVSFLHLSIDAGGRGKITFKDPTTSIEEVIDDELLSHQVLTVLYHHSNAVDVDKKASGSKKSFTKISLLDDSMHMSCSTNQHRIEDAFCRLFEENESGMADLFTRYFGARPSDKGDLSFEVDLLPRVTALFVYTRGEVDDEFGEDLPPAFNIYFEKETLSLLPGNYSELRVPEVLEDVFLRVIKKLIKNTRKEWT
ncbi:MAG: DUF3786 domain-containing protein [Promethearchaeota archaeon]